MILQRRWGFGLGTVFSLIVVYFIYLYSADKGWKLLTLISKWYLIIVSVMLAIPLIIIFLMILFSLVILLAAYLKAKPFRKKDKNKAQRYKNYIEAEYEIKE